MLGLLIIISVVVGVLSLFLSINVASHIHAECLVDLYYYIWLLLNFIHANACWDFYRCQRSSQCPMCWQPITMKDPTRQVLGCANRVLTILILLGY